jgi:hypothetical protein
MRGNCFAEGRRISLFHAVSGIFKMVLLVCLRSLGGYDWFWS